MTVPTRYSDSGIGENVRVKIDLQDLQPSCGSVAIVAIDGPSGAGKSTLAARLSHLHGAVVIGADDFHAPWEAGPLSWWPSALKLLEELSAGVLHCGGHMTGVRIPTWPSGSYRWPR
jgi:hypothetical protein